MFDKAIAGPRWRAIVNLPARTPNVNVSDLVCKVGLSQPAVSKHVREVGLVAVPSRAAWAV